MKHVHFEPTFAAWRVVAKTLLQQNLAPEAVLWLPEKPHETLVPAEVSLFENPENLLDSFPQTANENSISLPEHAPKQVLPFSIPRAFLEAAELAAYHRDPERWELLYRLLWRASQGENTLLRNELDPDVRRAQGMARQVKRDVHKVHAFVRFRRLVENDVEFFVAWHRPDNPCLPLATPLFVRRFHVMRWSVLTPFESAHWDGSSLRFAAGCPQELGPGADSLDVLWKTYYGSIFNPARVRVAAMKKEMPKRYWKTLPEASLIETMLNESPARLETMIAQQPPSALPLVPRADATWEDLRTAAQKCLACPLGKSATQTVFGEGPLNARVVLVGEQPGDYEDTLGKPFVGPAGALLERALLELDLQRGELYITNAVKHFKFKTDGKRRIHQRPASREIAACQPWLVRELNMVRPEILICLGASAAQSVLGRLVSVDAERGKLQASVHCKKTLVTIHPAAILRIEDPSLRELEFRRFVNDLRVALDTPLNEN